ncbi:hypothetical protein CQW23_20477 [Capsicum baccatum]|uniref:Kinetochore protein NDC80 n=1 Tax=Capsicum baccatum TaxID=33114 RepID=A0A2G2W8Q7_CAPBA|nr:hypothetical protein CQW23_20477 [Capsicum baccatum]
MRGAGRRRTNSAMPPDRRHPQQTPTANDPRQFLSTGGRDSDASFASSRPSSIGVNSRMSLLLSKHLFLLPEISPKRLNLSFLVLNFPHESQKLEDNLQTLLKSLNCPVKLNKSALRAPGTPHSWPSLLAAIHWLVQLCKFDDHRLRSGQPLASENKELSYTIESYLHYVRGEGDQEEELDRRSKQEVEQRRTWLIENMNVLEGNVKAQEAKLEAMKTGPSKSEVLENEM